MPHVFAALFAATGAPLADELELLPRRAGDALPVRGRHVGRAARPTCRARSRRSRRWSPGAGADWAAFLGTCAAHVARVGAVPRRPAAVAAAPPAAGRPRPTRATRSRSGRGGRCAPARARHARDPRLRMVIERFATYAGADPRRAPAALAVAGYVEHAFGAWHPRGGMYELVRALVRAARGARRRAAARRGAPSGSRVRDGARPRRSRPPPGPSCADAVVTAVDEATVRGRLLGAAARRAGRRALAVRPRAHARPARARRAAASTTRSASPRTTTPSSTTSSSTAGPCATRRSTSARPPRRDPSAAGPTATLVRARQRARDRRRRRLGARRPTRSSTRLGRAATASPSACAHAGATSSARRARSGGAIYGARAARPARGAAPPGPRASAASRACG